MQSLASPYWDWFSGGYDDYGFDPPVGGQLFQTGADVLARNNVRVSEGGTPLPMLTSLQTGVHNTLITDVMPPDYIYQGVPDGSLIVAPRVVQQQPPQAAVSPAVFTATQTAKSLSPGLLLLALLVLGFIAAKG